MTGRVRVRVRPGAREERLRGWHGDGALRLEVVAPPQGGRANEAVIRLLAAAVGVRRADVSVEQGLASRSKVIEVNGLSDEDLRRRIERALARGEGGRGE